MCKHIPNVQTQCYAKCCRKWYDCAECHAEEQDHDIQKDQDLILICKKCKKVFKVNIRDFDPEADGFCPRCDNHWFVEAENPNDRKQMTVEVELAKGIDEIDAIVDERDDKKMNRRQRLLEERIYKGDDGIDIWNMPDSDDE
ncbi:CHY_zinc finger domain-containing protein [Hexamita inflata]|uniref:CHY zinc finger domain-containing protein n=1 Tax=Hexamita inflata TaxID=28002 RepID=A0AA86Q1B1_9EUKA|nr:CHY zinc finger domain-containing protein [Hexamita inflata]CAI9947763.1 CHY zinc finger domain-containing protein [Hexamita inflata]